MSFLNESNQYTSHVYDTLPRYKKRKLNQLISDIEAIEAQTRLTIKSKEEREKLVYTLKQMVSPVDTLIMRPLATKEQYEKHKQNIEKQKMENKSPH